MNRHEQVYNLVWILLAIGVCAGSIRLSVWDPSGPGSGFIPFVTGSIIGIVGIFLFLREWTKRSPKGISERFWPNPIAAKRVLYILGGLCAMAYLMPILGFFLASFLITTFMLRVIEPQRWIAVISTSLVSCFLVYWLFARLLQVSLPKGFFGV